MELRRTPLHLTPLLLVLSLLTSLVSAQSGQGVLIDGNSRLPTCAQQCTLLQQAAQACTAATGPSTQTGWICFCQSAYLTSLRSSAVGICDAACTDPSDNAQVSVWYNGNCGDDNGASEHAEDGLNSQPSSDGSSNTDNGATTGSGSTNTNSGDSSSSNSNSNANSPPQNSSGSNDDEKSDKTWWAGHYQWIIMILVLIIAFTLFTWGLIFLKKRLDRKRDAMTGGFNAGITTRKVDAEKGVTHQTSGSTLHPSSASGRDSPARTREAFMPYGYGYSGSESRNGSKNEVIPLEEKKSPLARTTTMATEESKDGTEKSEVDGMGPWPVPGRSEKRPPGNGKAVVAM
ncbi:hypothetical protein TI39_contig259g00005 [Zymoseptoria brevis]|uniref:Integral membrane protein n=1 Tax=Zymoseptoria brevis TaxID=1047168 RepID=A0A0F4GYJ3_9PEZI|nr:hypothetical protein TI39_contig259g00005 [Zymoseptoria brevis]